MTLLLGICVSCEGFLDPKPDQSLVVPTTKEDIRSLLDNTSVFCRQACLPIIAGDEFYMEEGAFSGFSILEQSVYSWADDPYQNQGIGDWSYHYKQIFYANVALDAIDALGAAEDAVLGQLKGEALFHRAYAWYQLLQEFTPAFAKDGENGNSLGLVLKTDPDVNLNPGRSDLDRSYGQLMEDIFMAIELLPEILEPKTRPSKAAALGLLARIYLTQFEFKAAAEAAAEALELYPDRFDFNTMDVNASRPFKSLNKETVFYSQMISYSYFRSNQVFVDSLLMKSYGEGDLRIPVYFDESQPGKYNFTGKLTGNTILFGGITVGELQLIAAEGFARIGQDQRAMEYLNGLLENRISTDYFEPVSMVGDNLLFRVLQERKKELIGRGIRWTDLRRLNQEPRFSKVIQRTVGGETFEIAGDSPKYVFPIPNEEILRSGIEQNPR